MINLHRDNNTIKQVAESAAKTGGYKVFAVIKSRANTLNGINRAAERAFGTGEKEYEDESALMQSIREGFVSFHKDGFIIYIDGV